MRFCGKIKMTPDRSCVTLCHSVLWSVKEVSWDNLVLTKNGMRLILCRNKDWPFASRDVKVAHGLKKVMIRGSAVLKFHCISILINKSFTSGSGPRLGVQLAYFRMLAQLFEVQFAVLRSNLQFGTAVPHTAPVPQVPTFATCCQNSFVKLQSLVCNVYCHQYLWH